MRARALAAVCVFLGVWVGGTFGIAVAGDQIWLSASDLHLDPFRHSSRPARAGSDSNVALFESALAQMQRAAPQPSVILLPGDFFAHRFARIAGHPGDPASADVAGIQTMERIAAAFDRTFPKAQFAVALGNNDAPCGDYRSDVGDPFLRAVARIWAPLVNRRAAAPDFLRTFARAGYYAAALPLPRVRLVVLNTVLFSQKYRGACDGRAPAAASEELGWLSATLRATPRGTRNVVMMHIPPGYDAFSTRSTRGFLTWPFLDDHDNAALIDAFAANEDRVAFAIAGHAHRFDFRLAGGVPVIVLGSLSPVFHNNPSFYRLRVGSDGSLRDIETYAFDESAQRWVGPRSFDRAWNVAAIDASALTRLHAQLASDPGMRAAWDDASGGWPARRERIWRSWGDDVWRISWCAQTVLTPAFERCAGIERRVTLTRDVVVLAPILAAALLLTLLALVIRSKTAKPRGKGSIPGPP